VVYECSVCMGVVYVGVNVWSVSEWCVWCMYVSGVQASSETRGFGALLRQAKRINGGVKQLLLDAGFFVGKVMDTALEEGVEDLLCPEGGSRGASGEKKSSKGFAKSAFHYDEQRDCYECPAGEQLHPLGQSHDDGKRYTRYGGAPCQPCELREQCTSNPRGRTVKRYEDDEIKDALREVMRHPAARREYSRRQGMVEPVFSELKGIQGLQRFRRRGLDKVRLGLRFMPQPTICAVWWS